MSTDTPEVVLDGLCFGEGPRWYDGRLVFSDMHDHRVLALTPGGEVTELVRLDDAPSGLGWLPDGRLLVVAMHTRAVLRLDPDGLAVHADLSALAPHECNDMVVGADGRAYVSQFGYDMHGGAAPAPSPLLTVDPDGTPGIAAEDMAVANGMALTEDGRTLVVAESAGRRLAAFTVGAGGVLADRRTYAPLEGRDHPDGICLDAEGAAWVACPVADRFVRVLPGGEVTDVVPLDGRRAIACVLGDEDRRTLYLCTAATLGDPQQSAKLRAARIERVRVDVPGAGRP